MAARLAICSHLKRLLTRWWRRVSNVCHADPVVVTVILWPAAITRRRTVRWAGGGGLQEFDCMKRGAAWLLQETLLTAFCSHFYSWCGGWDRKFLMIKALKEAPLYRPTPHRAFCSADHSVSYPPFVLFLRKKKKLFVPKPWQPQASFIGSSYSE